MDDVLIYSKSSANHAEHVRLVLQKLREHRLFANRSKCEFCKTEISFLGHVVSSQGLKVDPRKVSTVQNWPTPSDVSQVRSFLGLGNYFRRFIQGYSNLVRPLNDLLKKGVPFRWDERCTNAFNGLKSALLNAPVLTLPDFSDSAPGFHVWCDASGYGIGAVLMQGGRVISYEARSLIPAERNYTTGEQELLAVVHALRTWRCYLEGEKDVKIMTDHAPNTFLPSQTTLSRRQARWSEFLQRFKTLSWHYKPGKVNVADPVSRSPNLLTVCATPAGAACAVGAIAVLSAPESPGRTQHAEDSMPTAGQEPTLLDRCREGYSADPYFTDGAGAQSDSSFEKYGRLWLHGDAVVVPRDNRLRDDIVYEAHDGASAGHGGTKATLARLSGRYFWSHGDKNMAEHVHDYVRSCDSCQRNKSSNQRPGGLLHPMPVPVRPWSSIGVDFVTGLPETSRGNDAILVCVDRFSKMVHLVPTSKSLNAPDCALLMFNNVYKLHGLPDDIVSDRDKLFTSEFWRELCRLLKTKQRMSTAFHPQTDGQTERANRTLQEVLRHSVSSMQDDWDTMLGGVELAINSAYHRVIDSSPFMLNYGMEPKLPLNQNLPARDIAGTNPERSVDNAETTDIGRVPAARKLHGKLAEMHAAARQHLAAAQLRQKQYADQKRREVNFSVGEQVLLSTKYFKLQGPRGGTSKLLPKYVGPFKVSENIGPVACRLELPPHWKVHPVFHVSLLKTYHRSGRYQPPPVPVEIEGALEYEVERVIDHRWRFFGKARRAAREFLVQWRGYPHEYDTWESEVNLKNCPEILLSYLDDRAAKGDESAEVSPLKDKPSASAASNGAPVNVEASRSEGRSATSKSRGRRSKRTRPVADPDVESDFPAAKKPSGATRRRSGRRR